MIYHSFYGRVYDYNSNMLIFELRPFSIKGTTYDRYINITNFVEVVSNLNPYILYYFERDIRLSDCQTCFMHGYMFLDLHMLFFLVLFLNMNK